LAFANVDEWAGENSIIRQMYDYQRI